MGLESGIGDECSACAPALGLFIFLNVPGLVSGNDPPNRWYDLESWHQ